MTTTITAPTGTLTTADGVWTWGAAAPPFGYDILLNGNGPVGDADSMAVGSDGKMYANAQGTWYVYQNGAFAPTPGNAGPPIVGAVAVVVSGDAPFAAVTLNVPNPIVLVAGTQVFPSPVIVNPPSPDQTIQPPSTVTLTDKNGLVWGLMSRLFPPWGNYISINGAQSPYAGVNLVILAGQIYSFNGQNQWWMLTNATTQQQIANDPRVSPPPPPPPPPPPGGPNTATLPSGEVIALSTTSVLPPGTTRTSDLDLRGHAAGWMVKSVTFNGCSILADSPGFVVSCKINNPPYRYPNGDGFSWQGAHDMVFINTDFANCTGQMLGCFSWNKVRVLCCGFINCQQIWSMDTNSDGSDGNDIEWGWCYASGFLRGGLETGGDVGNGAGQVFNNLYIHDGIWVDQGPQSTAAINALSIVARGQRGTRINGNFFRLGAAYGGGYASPIETSVVGGNAVTIDGNTFVDFADGNCFTDNGIASVVTNNKTFNCAQAIGTVLPLKPADPARQFAAIA